MAAKKKTKRASKPKPRSKAKPSRVRDLVDQFSKHRTKSKVKLEEAIDRGNELQVRTLAELAKWMTLVEKFFEPGSTLVRIAAMLPDINLRLALIEKLMWPRALLILRDDKGARCHRVNMPPESKGLSQAFTFHARHAGAQVLELQQLGAIPLIMLTVMVGGELVVDGGAVAAHLKVPAKDLDITAVVSVLA